MKAYTREYFSGANTPIGFHSYYNYILAQKEAEKIFCIKGGPGVGKSTLMKGISQYFSRKDESIEVFHCSADPSSIDGILLKERNIAIIDGTAPHIVDPLNPGAVDEIIDLAKYLDTVKLRANKKEILDLTEKISSIYDISYMFMECSYAYYKRLQYITDSALVSAKFEYKEIIELNRSFQNNVRSIKKFFGSAVSSEGVVNNLKNLASSVKKVYLIEVPIGYKTEKILEIFSNKLVDSGHDVTELYCPIDPLHRLEHLISDSADIAVFSCNKYHGNDLYDLKNIADIFKVDMNIKNSKQRGFYNMLIKEFETSIDKSINMLLKAKIHHDLLEEYYISSMDFEQLDILKDSIIKEIER